MDRFFFIVCFFSLVDFFLKKAAGSQRVPGLSVGGPGERVQKVLGFRVRAREAQGLPVEGLGRVPLAAAAADQGCQ